MDVSPLDAARREAVGKNVSRKLRRQGKVPAVLYGHDLEAAHLAVPERDLAALISHSGAHALVELKVPEGGRAKKHLAIIKEVQRHPMKDFPLHVDFQKVDLDEEIESVVPVALVGQPVGAAEGGILQHGVWEFQVRARARSLPDQIEVDVSRLGIGDSMRVGDITFFEGVEILNNPDEVVASILAPAKAVAAVEVVEVAPEVKEPELIQKEREEEHEAK